MFNSMAILDPAVGFQAGVIFAAAIILYALIFGLDAAKKAIPPSWVRIGMTLGVLLYGGTGIATWMLGGEFLNYTVFAPESTHAAGQHWGIFAVELGVLCTVASAMLAIFTSNNIIILPLILILGALINLYFYLILSFPIILNSLNFKKSHKTTNIPILILSSFTLAICPTSLFLIYALTLLN